MTHYLMNADKQKTSHVMSTDCPCKPKLEGIFEGTWKNMVGLRLNHQLLTPVPDPVVLPYIPVGETLTMEMLEAVMY